MRPRAAIPVVLALASRLASAESFYLAPDVPTDLAGGTYLPWTIVRNDSGVYSSVLALPFGTAVDGLHRLDGGNWLFSVAAPAELPAGSGAFFDPRDVVRFDGTGYTRFFDGAAAGVPAGSNVDAVFLDGGDSGDLILGFDVPTTLGGTAYDPADLVRFSGGAFTLRFDASAASPPIPTATNVTGADRRGSLTILTFDIPTTLGAATYLPGDLVSWNGVAFGLYYGGAGGGWPAGSVVHDFSFLPDPGSIRNSVRVDKGASFPAKITLRWSVGCLAGAEDYGIHEGVVGSWYSHTTIDCHDDGGDLTEEVAPAIGNRYYLVVPFNSDDEGSYGTRTGNVERPAGTATCRATQATTSCP